MTLTIINREQVWTVAGALLLVSCLQLFCGPQLYGQQPDIDAAAGAKAAGGLEALTRGDRFPRPEGCWYIYHVRLSGHFRRNLPLQHQPGGEDYGKLHCKQYRSRIRAGWKRHFHDIRCPGLD
jgi:hypothetical protein